MKGNAPKPRLRAGGINQPNFMWTLRETADHCFMQGYSSTQFMREIYRHPDCQIELVAPNKECYTPADEPEILALIETLGYEHTNMGFIKKTATT